MEIGDKAAKEITDDGSIDDTTVDGSNDDVIKDDWSDEVTEDDDTMADEINEGSGVNDENSGVGRGAGSRMLTDDCALLLQGRWDTNFRLPGSI